VIALYSRFPFASFFIPQTPAGEATPSLVAARVGSERDWCGLPRSNAVNQRRKRGELIGGQLFSTSFGAFRFHVVQCSTR